MSAGYIKLHRVIQDNPAWTSEPFTRSQAWIDMILSASYRPHSVRIRGIKIDLERGQLALSEVEYAKRWKWSRGKVNRFLSEIESKTVQQIVQQKTNVTSLVTILNYDKYQGDDTANDTTDGQQTGSKRAANGHIQEGKEREEGKEGKEQEGEAASACVGPGHVRDIKEGEPKPKPTAAEVIYQHYPKKVGRKAAIKAIEAAIKSGADPQRLLDRTKAYAAAVNLWSVDERQFVPNPATWYNQGRWDDDPATWIRKATNGNGTAAHNGATSADKEYWVTNAGGAK